MPSDFRRRVARRLVALNEEGQARTADESGRESLHGDAYDDGLRLNGVNGHAPEPPEGEPIAPEGELIAPEAEPWPGPPAPEAYHGLAGEIVRRIEPETEADPVAILIQFLTAFGNAAGRTAFCPVGRRRHNANLYCVLVGPTSYGGKGESWGWVDTLIGAAAPDWHGESVMGGLSSGEGLIKVAQDVREDGGRRVLAVEEEFGGTLRIMGREHSWLSAVLRQGWDGGRLRVATRNQPLRADNVHISLIGHVTPTELKDVLSATDSANGFANRILWAAVRRSKLLPEGGLDLSLADLEAQVGWAIDRARDVQYVGRTPAARALWCDRYAGLRAERPGLLGSVTTRAAAQVLRLSLVYALLDCARLVDEPHLHAALAVWDYCERTCRWLFQRGTGNGDADEILEALRQRPEGLTLRDVSALFGRNRTAAQIRAALNTLNAAGLAEGRRQRDTGGRPSERWKLVRKYEQNELNEQRPPTTTYGDAPA